MFNIGINVTLKARKYSNCCKYYKKSNQIRRFCVKYALQVGRLGLHVASSVLKFLKEWVNRGCNRSFSGLSFGNSSFELSKRQKFWK